MGTVVCTFFHLVAIGEFFTIYAKVVVLEMQEIIIIGAIVLVLIKMILKHNKDFSLELQVKILGLNIKIQSKEKKHPSSQ